MRAFRSGPPVRPSRVVLHIGAPLTGTTYLRETLARNRRRLTRHGVLFPSSHADGTTGHRDAVLDVLGLSAPGSGTTTGAWDRLAQTARDWRRGTVVVSHELLADADEDQARRIVTSFGQAEVHVAYVARGLARQLPLAWQEWVRNGGTATFGAYIDKVVTRDGHRLAQVFWRSHDVADVLARWATVVPAERVHVVTVPDGAGQDRATWGRFASVLGVDPTRLRVRDDRAERLDALAATESLRLLNVAGARRLPPAALARVEGPAPALHEERAAWVEAESGRVVDAVETAGYDVVGDLSDLRATAAAYTTDERRTSAVDADVVRAQTTLLAGLAGGRDDEGPVGRGRRVLRR